MKYVASKGVTIMNQMSEASKELIALVMGKNDDKAALYTLYRATYTPPPPPQPAVSAMKYIPSKHWR
jgi:hypothetical protein